MDLKSQSKHRDKNCPIWMYTKLFEVKKWLNMNSKQDKEYGRGDDITLLSEIIMNSRYWQVICNRNSVKFGADFKHILNFAEVSMMGLYSADLYFILKGLTCCT